MLPMRKGQSWLPNIFNDFLGNEWIAKVNESAPSINIMECEKRYRVEIATPGMTKDDFTIEIKNDNHLIVTMERKSEVNSEGEEKPVEEEKKVEEKPKMEKKCGCSWENHEDEELRNGKYLRREFTTCHFRQTLILPDNVDKAQITAKQENGILTIFIPKKESFIEAQAIKKIEIK